MTPYLYIPLISWAAVFIIMSIAFIWAKRIHNFSVVDSFWSFNFAVIAVIIWFISNGDTTRTAIVCTLAILWSLRLGIHLAVRIGSHIHEEEGRYKQLRKEWAANLNAKFFIFFQAQALSNIMLCIPFFLMALNPSPHITVLEYIGAAMWLISIIGEALADWQLKHFKSNPANKGKVCDVGLWHYSRHPNYFFQLMIWVSVFIFALSSPFGWLSIICPLSIGYLIFKVTGIPMTEEQSLRSKGDAYREYQRTTSVFVPWFKKK